MKSSRKPLDVQLSVGAEVLRSATSALEQEEHEQVVIVEEQRSELRATYVTFYAVAAAALVEDHLERSQQKADAHAKPCAVLEPAA